MKTAHDLLIPLLGVLVTASSAAASPRECRRFEGDRWDQRLSLAGCLRTAPLARTIEDPELLRGYVAYLESTATRPVDIYRDAIARGPFEVRLIAAYQLGQTYLDLIVRARSTVPPSLEHELDPLLAGLAQQAIAGFTIAWAIAGELPAGVPCDDVVRNVIAGTQAQLDAIELP